MVREGMHCIPFFVFLLKTIKLIYNTYKKKEERGKIMDKSGLRNEMKEAMKFSRVDIIKDLILENGVEVFYKMREGVIKKSPFHWAVNEYDVSLVNFLLDHGWNVNELDAHRDNALYYALYICEKDMVSLLLEKGIDINNKNDFGMTPILHAFEMGEGCAEKARLLYEKGADLNEKNNRGQSIFSFFSEEEFRYWIPVLLQEPERLNEEHLQFIKEKRLEFLYK